VLDQRASNAPWTAHYFEAALTDDCELLEPRGRFAGRSAILERIGGVSERFRGATVEITTQVDEHNRFARYGWKSIDREGTLLLDGIDVVERAADGRLRRVVMFFGALEPV
jgi:hypothetical protein